MALLKVFDDEVSLAAGIAERFVTLVNDALRQRGTAAICLTGGRTPKQLYELLAGSAWRDRIRWDAAHLYWSDERHVPPDHPDSNYGMTREALVMHVPIPAAQVHRIRGEIAPDEAARLYERELPPRFDVTLLGMGEDAHIASIFPGSPLVHERSRRAAAVWAPHLKAYRITLTPPSLVDTGRILMLVAGASKAPAVAAAFDRPTDSERWPVHLLRGADDRVEWFTDRAAARDVSSRRG
jgi:6-phosphogluconolactonase